MIINLGGEDVAVLTAGSVTDPYSQEAAESWSSGVTERTVHTLTPADPRPSDEPLQDARHAVKSGWTLYLPPGDPITAANRVRVRGRVYPVQGEPARYEWGCEVQAFGTVG